METKNLNTKYCVGLGEILFDVLPSGSQLGGAPANFAYHAGQHGLHSVAVSAVGKDALGETALRILDEKKLKYVMPEVDYPTGTVQVQLDIPPAPRSPLDPQRTGSDPSSDQPDSSSDQGPVPAPESL